MTADFHCNAVNNWRSQNTRGPGDILSEDPFYVYKARLVAEEINVLCNMEVEIRQLLSELL